jgi:hypothetical protein
VVEVVIQEQEFLVMEPQVQIAILSTPAQFVAVAVVLL